MKSPQCKGMHRLLSEGWPGGLGGTGNPVNKVPGQDMWILVYWQGGVGQKPSES